MASNIPLHCNICPKKPKFSDVSHLLTHIASKGHLSHYYKVKVRSGTDSVARQLIETYDQWYAEWCVEDLMSERMNLKDKKRPRTRASAVSRASSVTSSGPSISRTRPPFSRQNSIGRSNPPARPSPSLNALDPRLVDPNIKYEPKATPPLRTMDTAPMYPTQGTFPVSRGPYHVIRNQSKSNGYNGIFGPASGRRDSLFTDQDIAESPKSYTYPEPPKQSRYADPITISSTSPAKSIATPEREVAQDLADIDNSKLKGVLWPGMSLFDSATPTARRRRNQKKDASILEQLEASSLEVEPTELVFTPNGSLKKEKRITGNVDSSSSPWKSTPIRNDSRPPLVEVPPRKPYYGLGQLDRRLYDTYADDRADDELKYNLGKRKRAFQVYQDQESDHEDQEDEEDEHERATFSRPRPIKYLAQGFDKENKQKIRDAPVKLKQQGFVPFQDFNGHQFEHHNAAQTNNVHSNNQHHSLNNVADYDRQQYTYALSSLANAAANSVPYPTASNAYNTVGNNQYGLACPHFFQQGQINAMQQQYQFQMPPNAMAPVSNHNHSLSTIAEHSHERSFSHGLGGFDIPVQQQMHGYNFNGYGHVYPNMDGPSMFSTNGFMGFGSNGLYPMENHQGSASRSGSIFDHPTPAPMSESLAASPDNSVRARNAGVSPSIRKLDDNNTVAHGNAEDDGNPVIVAHAVDDNGYAPASQSDSEDEDRTITAPATPF